MGAPRGSCAAPSVQGFLIGSSLIQSLILQSVVSMRWYSGSPRRVWLALWGGHFKRLRRCMRCQGVGLAYALPGGGVGLGCSCAWFCAVRTHRIRRGSRRVLCVKFGRRVRQKKKSKHTSNGFLGLDCCAAGAFVCIVLIVVFRACSCGRRVAPLI